MIPFPYFMEHSGPLSVRSTVHKVMHKFSITLGWDHEGLRRSRVLDESVLGI